MSVSARSFARSREWMARASKVIPTGATSAARLGVRPAPLVVVHAEGARLTDADDNVYLDFGLANGPLLLGHNPPRIIDAVSRQMGAGFLYGAQHHLEARLAEALIDAVPSAEAVCLSTTGSEAVHAALRFARAATGRNTVVRFEGHYYGWLSDIHVSGPGTPPAAPGLTAPLPHVVPTAGLGASPDVLVARWNDPAGLEALLRDHGSEVAAVIMEPIPLAGVLTPAPGYLQTVRALTQRYGIVLIFDEVVTGFRAGFSGAQGRLGVTPDVTVLGKALGAGLPISAIAGRRDVLEVAAGPAPHMGTFNGHSLAAAAALAALEQYRRPGFDDELDRLTRRLAEGLRALGAANGLDLVVHQVGALLQTHFVRRPGPLTDYAGVVASTDRAAAAAFAESLLRLGLNVPPRNTWMLSSAHTEADIDFALDRAEAALAVMKENAA